MAELGIGTNEEAIVTGNILEDEKILGTAHVAFGASAAIGGTVQVPVHLDCVVLEPTVEVDGRPLVDAGELARLSGGSRRCSPSRTSPRGATRRGSRPWRRPSRAGVSLLDRHSDADHNRTVFTLAGPPGALQRGARRGAAAAIEAIDMDAHEGVHPAVGALDVCPLVWLAPADREAARSRGGRGRRPRIGEPRRARLLLRRARDRSRATSSAPTSATAAWPSCWLRMEAGSCDPIAAPALPHRTAGATLVTARPPLGAFNVELDSDDLEVARAVAAGLREAGGGLAGRARDRPAAGQRPHPGLDQRPRPARRSRWREVVERVRALAAPLGRPAASRPSWSA